MFDLIYVIINSLRIARFFSCWENEKKEGLKKNECKKMEIWGKDENFHGGDLFLQTFSSYNSFFYKIFLWNNVHSDF